MPVLAVHGHNVGMTRQHHAPRRFWAQHCPKVGLLPVRTWNAPRLRAQCLQPAFCVINQRQVGVPRSCVERNQVSQNSPTAHCKRVFYNRSIRMCHRLIVRFFCNEVEPSQASPRGDRRIQGAGRGRNPKKPGLAPCARDQIAQWPLPFPPHPGSATISPPAAATKDNP